MNTFYKTVGYRITKVLQSKHMQHQELANKLNISKQVMSKILNGDKKTTILEIKEIANILNVSIDSLLQPIEEDIVVQPPISPVFMGQVTTSEGKLAIEKANTIMNIIEKYESLNDELDKIRNTEFDFSSFCKKSNSSEIQ